VGLPALRWEIATLAQEVRTRSSMIATSTPSSPAVEVVISGIFHAAASVSAAAYDALLSRE